MGYEKSPDYQPPLTPRTVIGAIVLVMVVLAVVVWAGRAQAEMEADKPITFSVEQEDLAGRITRLSLFNGEWSVYAKGTITPGTTERFLTFIKSHDISYAKVIFDSPGGSLGEGISLGSAIRELGFDTSIGREEASEGDIAICASACAYAFAGGSGRFLDDKAGRLGVHQFYGHDKLADVGSTQEVSGLIVAYLERMGVKAQAFTLSTTAGPDGIVWLDSNHASVLGFVNNGVAPTTAEIKLVNLHPYLRLEQSRHEGQIRVLFTCLPSTLSVMAGIVTNPELSQQHQASAKESYLELNHQKVMSVGGGGGSAAQGSVLWITRELAPATAHVLLGAHSIGAWTWNGGALVWGLTMDLDDVQPQIKSYLTQCGMA